MHNQTAILFFYKGKKMKLLSFAIPCYNSKDYMEHCIESILPGGDDVEIIIVDDGSKDETAAIADRYAAEYPDIVKAVHQEMCIRDRGNRLANNAGRYGLCIQENGTTVLMWCIFGTLICGIGPFIAMHILIKNSNMICNAYNRTCLLYTSAK